MCQRFYNERQDGQTNAVFLEVAFQFATPRFKLLGEVRWNVDMTYGGAPVGGLSSIDWDAARGEFVLASDDRSVHGPARV